MKKTNFASVCVLFGLGIAVASTALAQQVTIGTPMQRNGDSFSESIGSSWGVSGKNWSFNFGGGGASPQFGGSDTSGGANVGISYQKGDVNGYFRGWASQSSDRSSSTVVPSATMMNGQQAYVGAVSEHPFVTSVTPVVGNYNRMRSSTPPGMYHTALQERLQRMQSEQQMHQKYSKQNEGEEPAPTRKRAKETTKRWAEEETASERSSAETGEPAVRSSRGSNRNAGTAERPARSVAEMKRQHADQVKEAKKADSSTKSSVSKKASKKGKKATAKKSSKKNRSKKSRSQD